MERIEGAGQVVVGEPHALRRAVARDHLVRFDPQTPHRLGGHDGMGSWLNGGEMVGKWWLVGGFHCEMLVNDG